MKLTNEQINKINNKCPSDQGVFNEPYGCDGIKELIVYMRWSEGGSSGGNCWNDDESEEYDGEDKPKFKALDMVLEILKPEITYLQFKKIEESLESTTKHEWEYYGNYDDYGIEYIKLKDLIEILESFYYSIFLIIIQL